MNEDLTTAAPSMALLAAAGLTVFAILVVVALAVRSRRRSKMQQVASSLGLRFSPRDTFGTARLPFDLFTKGRRRRVENVMWGSIDGLPVRLFEYWHSNTRTEQRYEPTRQRYETVQREDRHHFSCCLVEIPSPVSHIVIRHASLLDRAARRLLGRGITLGSERFNRAFFVSGESPRAASEVIDERMMEWLLRLDGKWSFEVRDFFLLAYCPRLGPRHLPVVLRAALGFRALIPKVRQMRRSG
jgi:hypothetical protein